MSHDESSLRRPPVKTDEMLLDDMGVDPTAWALEFQKVLGPFGTYSPALARAWFHHAIEAGRNAERGEISLPPPGDVTKAPERSPRVWGASGFELRTCAVTARMALARIREFIGAADAKEDAALDHVDWMLGSMIEDRVFRDGVDDAAAMVAAGAGHAE